MVEMFVLVGLVKSFISVSCVGDLHMTRSMIKMAFPTC